MFAHDWPIFVLKGFNLFFQIVYADSKFEIFKFKVFNFGGLLSIGLSFGAQLDHSWCTLFQFFLQAVILGSESLYLSLI